MNNADFTEFVKDIVCQLIDVGAHCQRTGSFTAAEPGQPIRSVYEFYAERLEQKLRKLQTVMVPHWALEFIMDNACFMDEGPLPEGWSSPEMNQARNELEKALEK